MLAVRFLFGAGEAGAWPNAARTFSRWIPAPERGRVQGVFFAGAFLFGGLTPALVGLLEPHVGWRGVFRLLRADRLRLGGCVVPLVPRRAGRPSPGRSGGARR